MKKLIFIGGGIVLVLIIIGLILTISNLGPIIKTAVNTYGPKITRTELKLDDVGISIWSGKLKLKGFLLGNPAGFKSPEAVKVKSIYLAVNKKSLMKDPIVIDTIEIVRPEITYEKSLNSDNFSKLIENIKKSTGSGKASQEKPAAVKGGGKKMLIRDLTIKEGKVTLATSLPLAGGQSVSAVLPDIHLKNIGGQNEGTSAEKVAEIILAELYKKITSPDVTKALNEELKTISKDAQKELGGAADKAAQDAGKEVEGAADKAVKDIFK